MLVSTQYKMIQCALPFFILVFVHVHVKLNVKFSCTLTLYKNLLQKISFWKFLTTKVISNYGTYVDMYACMYVCTFVISSYVHYLEHVDTSWLCGPGMYSSSAVRQHRCALPHVTQTGDVHQTTDHPNHRRGMYCIFLNYEVVRHALIHYSVDATECP